MTIVPLTAPVILHRMAAIEARELSATGALVAKFRGDALIRQTIERLNTPDQQSPAAPGQLDKTA